MSHTERLIPWTEEDRKLIASFRYPGLPMREFWAIIGMGMALGELFYDGLHPDEALLNRIWSEADSMEAADAMVGAWREEHNAT